MNRKVLKKKIRRNLRDYGPLLTLVKGMAYFCRLVYERKRYISYKIDLDGVPLSQLGKSNFIFRLLGAEETEVIDQIEEMEEWLENRLADKLRANSFCMVVLYGEKVAAFNLVTMNEVEIPLINMKKILRPDGAWSEQITVSSDFRRSGLGTELRHRVYAELESRGIRKFYGGTLACNKASLNLAKRAGFRFLADITYQKFMNYRRWGFKRARI